MPDGERRGASSGPDGGAVERSRRGRASEVPSDRALVPRRSPSACSEIIEKKKKRPRWRRASTACTRSTRGAACGPSPSSGPSFLSKKKESRSVPTADAEGTRADLKKNGRAPEDASRPDRPPDGRPPNRALAPRRSSPGAPRNKKNSSSQRADALVRRTTAPCFFFKISEHADGERRGPVSI